MVTVVKRWTTESLRDKGHWVNHNLYVYLINVIYIDIWKPTQMVGFIQSKPMMYHQACFQNVIYISCIQTFQCVYIDIYA
jgi:hypothetical protein